MNIFFSYMIFYLKYNNMVLFHEYIYNIWQKLKYKYFFLYKLIFTYSIKLIVDIRNFQKAVIFNWSCRLQSIKYKWYFYYLRSFMYCVFVFDKISLYKVYISSLSLKFHFLPSRKNKVSFSRFSVSVFPKQQTKVSLTQLRESLSSLNDVLVANERINEGKFCAFS